MNIAFVASGHIPIPPPGWGAVEILLTNYKKHLEAQGHQVDIYNSVWIHEVVHELQTKNYDFIHLHCDLYTGFLNKHLHKPFCVTSHYGKYAIYTPYKTDPNYDMLFEDILEAPGAIIFSEPIAHIYKQAGYIHFLKVLRNPVETEKFTIREKGNGKALVLGRIQPRKRQSWLAKIVKQVAIDFIGPYDRELEPNFQETENCKYKGTWTKDQVYEHLSEYSCLVLLSESEASPLVVLEALAAGVSVVINEASSHNMTHEPFITILSNTESNGVVIEHALQHAIDSNANQRSEIRKYAARFDYTAVLKDYLQIIEDFRAQSL